MPAPHQIAEETSLDKKTRLRLWLQLLKTTRRIETVVRENLRREFDSTLPRFDVMAALDPYKEGLKMSMLSSVLKVSNGNVTGIVDRLVADGCVVRVAVPGDRRASVVHLTAKGQKQFDLQAAEHEIWINQLLNDFTGAEAQTLHRRFDIIDGRALRVEDTK